MSPSCPYDFSGKNVVITGAASGIGRAACAAFAAGGARVIGIDRDAKHLDDALASLPQAANGRHRAIIADLRPADAAARVIRAAAQEGHLDVLVNSAGVCHFTKASAITTDEWDEVHEIDVRALFFLAVAFAEQVAPGKGGRIINLGSNAGRKGRAVSAHYAAAKAAVANITESLALSYGVRNVTANTVCPAVVLTPMWEQNFRELTALTGKSPAELSQTWTQQTPLRRLGSPEDVVNLITFLASDRGAFITGQEINVCGGFMLTC